MNVWTGVVSGLVALACSAEVSDSRALAPPESEETERPGASPETVIEAHGTIVAKLTRSATHEIVFREYPDLRVITASESLHADLDRSHSTLAAMGVRPGMPIHEIYRVAAGAEADSAVTDYLRRTEERFAASLVHNTGWATPKGLGPADHPVDPEVEGAKTTSESEPVATLSQALCSEPPWDWPADEAWFKSNFCYVGAQYCDSLDAQHSSYLWGGHSDSAHFNQSHCSAAKTEVWLGYLELCGPLGFDLCWRSRVLAKLSLPPRYVRRLFKNFSGPLTQWAALISSSEGNFTGLGHFVY